MARVRGRRRWPVVVATTVGVLVGVGGGVWAGATLLSPPADVLADPGYVVVEAEDGAVGQSLRLNATARWSSEQTVTGSASGTVTTVPWVDGALAAPGDVLYSVDMRPVTVAEGAIPAYRDLAVGARGDDVLQLQRLLAATGHLTAEPDGRFGRTTDRAVRAWRAGLGQPSTGPDAGVVRRGEVLFVPTLPSRLAIGSGVAVGDTLDGAHEAAQILGAAPSFTVSLAENQTALVAPGMAVDLTPADGTWRAVVTEVRPADDERPALAVLASVDDAPICADACGSVPVGAELLIPATIHVVPEVSGVVVPAAAIVTPADGRTGVTLSGGTFREVSVVASARGRTVVDGVAAGERVRTPGRAP